MSVFELAALQKLRRIGLVRVNNLTDQAVYALTPRRATLERLHLSFCNQISVFAINFMLQKLPKLNHLSLTGIDAFKNPEFQQFCRQPPSVSTFNRPPEFSLDSTLHRILTQPNGLHFAYFPGKASSSSASTSKRDIHLSSRPTARMIPIMTTTTMTRPEWPLDQMSQAPTTTPVKLVTLVVTILQWTPVSRPMPPVSTVTGLTTLVFLLGGKPMVYPLYKPSSEQRAVQVLPCNRDRGRDSSRHLGGLADIPHKHRGRCQARQRCRTCTSTGRDHLLYVGSDNNLWSNQDLLLPVTCHHTLSSTPPTVTALGVPAVPTAPPSSGRIKIMII